VGGVRRDQAVIIFPSSFIRIQKKVRLFVWGLIDLTFESTVLIDKFDITILF
jgi:hypothetical protein